MKQYLDIQLHSKDDIQQFNDTQIAEAITTLEKYIPLMQNDNRIFEKGTDLILSGDFNDVSLKRSTLIDSKIQKVNFGNSALTSSYFCNTNFYESNFNESNMQYCQFIQNIWENIIILSTNLSYSNLNSALNYNEEGTGTFILNALKIAL